MKFIISKYHLEIINFSENDRICNFSFKNKHIKFTVDDVIEFQQLKKLLKACFKGLKIAFRSFIL